MRAFHFLPRHYGLAALEKQRLKVATFDNLNDPFELIAPELTDARYRLGYARFKKHMAKQYGLLCFSKSWSCPLMWSHYADKHAGVALEFELADELANLVRYQTERVKIDITKKLASKTITDEDGQKILNTKFKQWEYEEEVRIFLKMNDPPGADGLHFQDFNDSIALVGVIQGPLCELSHREVTRSLPKGKSLILTRARLAFRSFEVIPNRAFPSITIQGTL